jgi:hypothetical protein
MLQHLRILAQLRGRHAGPAPAALARVKAFQAARLASTYRDLDSAPRYHPATRFFLDDLYGPYDQSWRDADLARIYPMMVKLLPAKAVETATLAVELDAISETMDHRLAGLIAPGEGPLSVAAYVEAYCAAGGAAERARQIALIREVGDRLEGLVTHPLVYNTLRLMRQPARIAGLGMLQEFLERGAAAFKHMRGANEFLSTIEARENQINAQVFARAERPFEISLG